MISDAGTKNAGTQNLTPKGVFSLKVSSIMDTIPCLLTSNATIGCAISAFEKNRCWMLPVATEDGSVRGALFLDKVMTVVAQGSDMAEVVGPLVISVCQVDPDTNIDELCSAGNMYAIIVHQGKAVGIVTPQSFVKAFTKQGTELYEVKVLAETQGAIINSLYDGIYITDCSGYTIDINDAYERITGIRREELIGRHMKELIELGYFESSASLKVLERHQSFTIVDNIRGGIRCLTTGTPVFNREGHLVKVVSCVRNLQELASIGRMREDFDNQEKHCCSRSNRVCTETGESLIVGRSQVLIALLRTVQKVAEVDVTVLIIGETGVGKELIAREIHRMSPRGDGPFIGVNCAAIPSNLMESEMFGYEKGAFTGANPGGKPGMFEIAKGGTIFLDEIGDMELELQAKLLRVLEEKELTRIGGTRVRELDVRIIAASNQNLEERVKQGLLREDLYYRLNVLPLVVPPLRER